jgi:uncharacterized oxidoreductase
VDGSASPEIVGDTGALVRIDGRGGYGQVAGSFAARLGSARARVHGVCLLTIENAGHFGRNALWPEMAAAEGVASIHFGHGFGSAPLVAPHGGTSARLRTSPLAFGAPGPDGQPIVLDFSVAALSFNSVKVLAERGERLPAGAAIAPDGSPTDDPRLVLDGIAALLPFGGFKGYGLAVFAEIFAGILGAHGATAAGTNAMLSIYFDVAGIADGAAYHARLAALVASLRETPVAPGSPGVMAPGDRSRRARSEAAAHGLSITPALRRSLEAAADRAAVPLAVRRQWPHPLQSP